MKIANGILLFLIAASCSPVRKSQGNRVEYAVSPQASLFKETDPSFRIFNYSEGRARVRINSHQYRFIDLDGHFAFEESFTNAGDFHNGLARVFVKGKYGYINREGTLMIPAIYDKAHDFSSYRTLVEKDGRRMIIDMHGTPIFKLPYKISAEVRVDIRLTHRYDLEQNPVVHLYKNGFLRVQDIKTGRVGFLDTLGRVKIPPQFDQTTDFDHGIALVKRKRGKQVFGRRHSGNTFVADYGVIDTSGKGPFWLDLNKIPIIDDFYHNEKYIPFYKEEPQKGHKLYGVMNKYGDVIVDAKYKNPLQPFSDGVMLLRQNDTLFLLGEKGKMLHKIPLQTDSTKIVKMKNVFREGLLAVEVKSSKDTLWGYLNKKGDFVIFPQFLYAENFHNGRAVVFVEGEKQAVIKNPLKKEKSYK